MGLTLPDAQQKTEGEPEAARLPASSVIEARPQQDRSVDPGHNSSSLVKPIAEESPVVAATVANKLDRKHIVAQSAKPDGRTGESGPVDGAEIAHDIAGDTVRDAYPRYSSVEPKSTRDRAHRRSFLFSEFWAGRNLIFAGAAIGAVLAAAIWLLPPARYEAVAVISVALPIEAPDPETARVLVAAATKNEGDLLNSRRLAEKTVASAELYSDVDFRRVMGLPDLLKARTDSSGGDNQAPPEALFNRIRINALQRFSERLTVLTDEQTGLLEVRFYAENPHLAARIVNALVGYYLFERVGHRNIPRSATQRGRDGQLEGNPTLSDQGQNSVIARLSELALRRSHLEGVLEVLLRSVSDLSVLEGRDVLDPQIKDLWNRYKSLTAPDQAGGSGTSERDQNIASLRVQLNDRIGRVTTRIATEIDDMSREEQHLRENSLSQARDGVFGSGMPELRVISLADAPVNLVRPNLFSLFLSLISIGAAIGAAISFIIVLRAHVRNNAIRLISQAVQSTLLILPRENRWRFLPDAIAPRRRAEVQSRRLRTMVRISDDISLRAAENPDRPMVVLFIPVNPDLDIESAVLEIGRSLASAGRRTVVVETDASRPILARRLDLPMRPGFIDIILAMRRLRHVRIRIGRHHYPLSHLGIAGILPRFGCRGRDCGWPSIR